MTEIVAQPEPFEASSLSRVWQHTRNSNIGIITAFHHDATAHANRANNGILRAAIHGRFGYLKIRARFIVGDDSVDEESLLVIGTACNDSGNLLGFLRQQGQLFGRGRFVFKPDDNESAYLYCISEGAFPSPGRKQKLGSWRPDRMAEYHALLFTPETFDSGAEHAQHYTDFRFVRCLSFFSRVEAEF